MGYITYPKEISIGTIRSKRSELSPSMYQQVTIATSRTKQLAQLLDPANPFDKGAEPGSIWYISNSSHYFVRTKAFQNHSFLPYQKGDAIIPINPRVFVDANLGHGDILLSKDSNIGESVILWDDDWCNHMFSSGVVRLNPSSHPLYLFAFLKHPVFKAQLTAMTPRGSTISHAKSRWLECLVPFPNQDDSDCVIRFVSMLTQAIIEKEQLIRRKDEEIIRTIDDELMRGSVKMPKFVFSHPKLDQIRNVGRLDAAIYSTEFREKIYLIENYYLGTETPTEMGFTVTPGPSLEIKMINTRLDSDHYKPGYYGLILPKNISEYGTMNRMQYIGTGKKLPLLRQGDIVFGEAGFQKGRSVVLIDPVEYCTTNAHGLYARHKQGDLVRTIFFRCMFNWYRRMRLIDLIGVGGSGGHLSPSYFDTYLRIPKFPDRIQSDIARLYHNPDQSQEVQPTLDGFLEYHRSRDGELGIWDLHRDIRNLRSTLMNTLDVILGGNTVTLPVQV